MRFQNPDNLKKAIEAQAVLNECFATYSGSESYKKIFGHNTPIVLDVENDDLDTITKIRQKTSRFLTDLLFVLEDDGRVLRPYDNADGELLTILADERHIIICSRPKKTM